MTALVMSWLASKRMYKPVEKLISLFEEGKKKRESKDEFQWIEQQIEQLSNESELLQERLSAQVPDLKKQLFNAIAARVSILLF